MNRLLIWTTILSILSAILWYECYWKVDFNQEAHWAAYGQLQGNIHEKRLNFEQDWKTHPQKREYLRQAAKDYIYQTLTDSLFKYWYGTPWDFNGTTQKPRGGKIACGYFVTTTLSHLQFYLPRVKMAQQAASRIIRSLCPKSSIKVFNQLQQLQQHLSKQPDGIYIIGLDTHVGFMWKTNQELYFVHSSYSGQRQVSKEKWNESQVLGKSKLLMVGNLTDNTQLIEDWILGRNIALSK
jgi:hypothetical protein